MDKRQELLLAVQDALTEALGKFDAVCKRHNVPYWIHWGTLLGAVRHQGFIPWDDDVDVGMLREDFEKLCEIPKSEWTECGLTLVGPCDDDMRHDKLFARLYLDGTRIQSMCDLEWQLRDTGERWSTSLLIDIYLFDWVPADDESWLKNRQAILELRNKYRYMKFAKVPVAGGLAGLKARIRRIQGNRANAKQKDPWKDVARECDRIAKTCTERTRIGCYLDDTTTDTFAESDIFPLVDLQFGNLVLPGPNQWDRMLADAYGDYMTPPPVDNRVHINFIYADLGERGKYILDTPPGSLGAQEK